MLQTFIGNQLLVLLAIILVGYVIGHLKVRGISLGSSACLFVAILAGYLGAQVSPIIMNLGIVFFVYSIGLEAGPRFFRLFNRRGLKFAFLSIFTVVTGALTAMFIAIPLGIDIASSVGIFAGAMTSTPALASAIHAVESYLPTGAGQTTSLGYAVAYPFGLISEILFVQIVPKLFSKRIEAEKVEIRKEMENSDFRTHEYRLTNENFANRTIKEMDIHEMCHVNLTRFKRNGHTEVCLPSTKFQLGDVVVAVGSMDELAKFRVLFGSEVGVEPPAPGHIEIKDVLVSNRRLVGRPLNELLLPETYGVTVTRLYRGDTMITPTGSVMFEVGDFIRVVGTQESVDQFTSLAGQEKRRLDDTNILILAFGMFIGAAIGEIPIVMGSFTFKLGLAGGPLFVALLLSHFGKIGKWSVRIPNATKFFIRELGLVFFLIGVGIKTGAELLVTTEQHNILGGVALGAIVSLVSMFGTMFVIHNVFREPLISSLGALCGAKTSSPSLGVLIKTVDDNAPAVSYAAAYPVALIMLTLVGQLFVWAGMNFLK